jgi:uncharacterized membrane protein
MSILSRLISLGMLVTYAGLCFASSAEATSGDVTYNRGQILSVSRVQGSPDVDRVKLLTGNRSGATISATTSGLTSTLDVVPPAFKPGDVVIVSEGIGGDGLTAYTVIDHFRLFSVAWIFGIVIILAIIFAGRRGIGSLAGLVMSVAILALYIIPQALKTGNPYPPTLLGGALIAILGIYTAHGISRRTSLALISSYMTLILAIGMSFGIVGLLHLDGISTENTYYLRQLLPGLNIQGLLVCGMIISMIGVLDDITVGQATAVEELLHANRALSPRQLYTSALKIGREHIASLINTLVLAYVGSSLLFIAYLSTVSPYPWWITINSSLVMEETARSLVGSITLILAVPLTTLIASRYITTKSLKE